jgi:gamma-glutamyl hercynylcysteine S-oxide synthase
MALEATSLLPSHSAALSRLREAWALSDALFTHDLSRSRALSQPIALRHPFVFYLGHLPAFTRRVLRALSLLPEDQHHPYDTLFERGIDPDVDDPDTVTHPASWPEWDLVVKYRDDVRAELVELVVRLPDSQALHMLAEHDLMHVETLYYMLAQLVGGPVVRRPPRGCDSLFAIAADEMDKSTTWLHVPAGYATIGRDRSRISADEFVWDNELTSKSSSAVRVPAFEVADLPVTVSQYVVFVRAGGYTTRRYWKCDDDWKWVSRSKVECPASWRLVDALSAEPAWAVATVDGLAKADGEAADWPVSVSLAEARAYATFVESRLLTEAEWDRVAYSAHPDLPQNGRASVEPELRGNFGLARLRRPTPVGRYPAGNSWVGARDIVGNGWELVDTKFSPLDEFQPTPLYPEYSQDFFDSKHFVLKGASWATHTSLVRRSFRNFYQPHYAYMFCKFRLARSSTPADTSVNA